MRVVIRERGVGSGATSGASGKRFLGYPEYIPKLVCGKLSVA